MKNWTSSPTGVGDPNYQIASQVKNIACGIWNSYASGFVPNNPITSPIKHFWNSSCAMPPTSAPPVTPPPPDFSGGQCDGILYGVRYQTAIISGGTLAGWSADQQTTSNAPVGAIQSVDLYVSGQLAPTLEHWSFNGSGVPPVFNNANRPYFLRIVDSVGVKDVAIGTASGKRFIEFFRIDGQPDNCGNPPSQYPPIIPPGPTTYNIDITDSQSVITIPITWTGDFSIPLTFNFEGGVINFDFGGISIEWSGDLVIGGGGTSPYPEKPPITLPPGQPPPGGGGTNPKPGDPPVIIAPPITVTPTDPIEEEPEEDEAFLYLEIIVTAIQQDSKFIIENVNPADSIYFAGYVSFTVKGKPGSTSAPEIPIRRQKNLIKIPPEYDGYRVRATNGANLTVTSFSIKKNPAET